VAGKFNNRTCWHDQGSSMLHCCTTLSQFNTAYSESCQNYYHGTQSQQYVGCLNNLAGKFKNRTTEHSVTNNATVCYKSITRCHNTTQHVLKVARSIRLANICNIMSDYFSSMAKRWHKFDRMVRDRAHDGANVPYSKQHGRKTNIMSNCRSTSCTCASMMSVCCSGI
jgi:hypothetical protein